MLSVNYKQFFCFSLSLQPGIIPQMNTNVLFFIWSSLYPTQDNWLVHYLGLDFCWFHRVRKMSETCVSM